MERSIAAAQASGEFRARVSLFAFQHNHKAVYAVCANLIQKGYYATVLMRNFDPTDLQYLSVVWDDCAFAADDQAFAADDQ